MEKIGAGGQDLLCIVLLKKNWFEIMFAYR